MARFPGWMTVISERPAPDRRAWIIEFRLARFWWAHPSFWVHFLRMRSLR
jgi:hypothetical protein